ncbi:unnamed protein product, partial [Laminaria digitata]
FAKHIWSYLLWSPVIALSRAAPMFIAPSGKRDAWSNGKMAAVRQANKSVRPLCLFLSSPPALSLSPSPHRRRALSLMRSPARSLARSLIREVYERAQRITSAVPHPRTLATILECGGKMHMQAR